MKDFAFQVSLLLADIDHHIPQPLIIAGSSPAMMSGGGLLQAIMPGLDPGILFLATKKDRRVKPGEDEWGGIPQAIMPGRDPGILFLAAKKDRRVKPGDDDVVEMSTCFLLPLAQQRQSQGGGERRGVA